MIYGTLNESDSISPSDDKENECTNPECIDGMVPEYTVNDIGEIEKEMVRCECQK